MSTNITEKIEALLRKAESTEFEAEREAFSAKAEKLMIQYGIEMAQLNMNERHEPTDKVITSVIHITGIYQMALMSMAIKVAKAMGASGFYTDLRRVSKTIVVTIVDFETTMPNTLRIVNSIMEQATFSMGFWWAANKPFVPTNEGYIARRSYLDGFSQGAADRIRSERQEAVNEVSGAGELVLVRSGEIAKVLNDHGVRPSKGRRTFTPDAMGAGRRDGRNADTNIRTRISR